MLYSKVEEFEKLDKKSPPTINVNKCRVLPDGNVTAIEDTSLSNEINEENADITEWKND